MKVAVAQISSYLGNLEKNIDKHLEYCDRAISEKADVIVFPELSLTGYSLKDINYEICLNPYTSSKLDKLKEKSKQISIICGLVEEGENSAVYNSAAYIEEGEVKFTHRKVYPPTYGIFEELRYFTPGHTCKTHDTKFGKIGLLVCEDLWHLSLPLTQALDGAQIIFGIAASPTKLGADMNELLTDTTSLEIGILEHVYKTCDTKFDSFDEFIESITADSDELVKIKNYYVNSDHHKTYARLLSLFLVFCNRVGYEDGVNFWGGSEIVNPFGKVMNLAKFIDDDVIYSDIDLGEITRSRRLAGHFLDEKINLTIENLVKVRDNRS
jgi:NAD+ synthase (glutamine-hydrolysing)